MTDRAAEAVKGPSQHEGVAAASSRLNLDELDKMLVEGAGIEEPYEVIASLVERVRELQKTALHFWDERDEARATIDIAEARGREAGIAEAAVRADALQSTNNAHVYHLDVGAAIRALLPATSDAKDVEVAARLAEVCDGCSNDDAPCIKAGSPSKSDIGCRHWHTLHATHPASVETPGRAEDILTKEIIESAKAHSGQYLLTRRYGPPSTPPTALDLEYEACAALVREGRAEYIEHYASFAPGIRLTPTPPVDQPPGLDAGWDLDALTKDVHRRLEGTAGHAAHDRKIIRDALQLARWHGNRSRPPVSEKR